MGSHGRSSKSPSRFTSARQSPRECIICKKQNCWPFNHSKEDQNEAWKRVKQARPKYGDHQIKQLITAYEGFDDDENEAEESFPIFDFEDEIANDSTEKCVHFPGLIEEIGGGDVFVARLQDEIVSH